MIMDERRITFHRTRLCLGCHGIIPDTADDENKCDEYDDNDERTKDAKYNHPRVVVVCTHCIYTTISKYSSKFTAIAESHRPRNRPGSDLRF